MLFDQKQFGSQGLWHLVFKTRKKNFQPLSEVWNAMKIKMSQPIFNLEPPPNGWVPAEVFTMTYCSYTHTLTHTQTYTLVHRLKTLTTLCQLVVPSCHPVFQQCQRRPSDHQLVNVVKVNLPPSLDNILASVEVEDVHHHRQRQRCHSKASC